MIEIIYTDTMKVTLRNAKDWIFKDHLAMELKVKQKSLLFFTTWKTVRKITIEIKTFWGYGALGNNHLTISGSYGGILEVWPPNEFNFKERADEMVKKYNNELIENLKINNTIKTILQHGRN